jgi:hypothetical protein
LPLRIFIEQLYRKDHPDVVLFLEDRARPHEHPGNRPAFRSNVATSLVPVQAVAEAGSWRKTIMRLSGQATEA